MKQAGFFIAVIVFLMSCNKATEKNAVQNNDRMELVPEPDKAERLKYEALQELKKSGCIIEEPSMSINGIQLLNGDKTGIMKQSDKIDSLDQYHFYSKLESETLTLTKLAGSGKYDFNLIKIQKSDKASYGYRELNVNNFKTEKGLQLGMSKKDVIGKLGNCYAAIDSTENYIELYYRIENTKDTKSKLLEKYNMPVYYGSYKFYKDQLAVFEFGFEYP